LDNEDIPQLARFFYHHAGGEREHAMKMVQYFIDCRRVRPEIPCAVAAAIDSCRFACGRRGRPN
jgi:ferritin